MRTGTTRITRAAFYQAGGFSNPLLFRKRVGKAWHYYRLAE